MELTGGRAPAMVLRATFRPPTSSCRPPQPLLRPPPHMSLLRCRRATRSQSSGHPHPHLHPHLLRVQHAVWARPVAAVVWARLAVLAVWDVARAVSVHLLRAEALLASLQEALRKLHIAQCLHLLRVALVELVRLVAAVELVRLVVVAAARLRCLHARIVVVVAEPCRHPVVAEVAHPAVVVHPAAVDVVEVLLRCQPGGELLLRRLRPRPLRLPINVNR
mmetsp:Transcript_41723/g.105186  ORF Transcript_41723/g.105186 Transcript_41723/m.105186 type:complete len:220 (+) Transcript_41723:2865-3524(+)